MVKYDNLDQIFHALSDATRRDMLGRVKSRTLSISELAEPYDQSLASVSKHLKVLERAELVKKERRGTQILVATNPKALKRAAQYLERYRELWEGRLDRLEEFLNKK